MCVHVHVCTCTHMYYILTLTQIRVQESVSTDEETSYQHEPHSGSQPKGTYTCGMLRTYMIVMCTVCTVCFMCIVYNIAKSS